jgi:hypothetical protein
MSGKRLFKSLVGVALVLVALCAGVGLYARTQASRSRRNAETLLAELRGMKVGETTREEVQRLVRIQRPYVSEAHRFVRMGFVPTVSAIKHTIPLSRICSRDFIRGTSI